MSVENCLSSLFCAVIDEILILRYMREHRKLCIGPDLIVFYIIQTKTDKKGLGRWFLSQKPVFAIQYI